MPQTVFAQNAVPPALICIAQHESEGNQFNSDGSVLKSSTDDYGIMQIHSSWLPLSKKFGLDILHNAKDNVTMGIYIYNVYGPEQWTTYKKYCVSDTS